MPVDSTRSRSGCLTCRKRKKKCDEEFGPTGACRRCHAGSWECVRPSAEPKRIIKRATSPKSTIKAEPGVGGASLTSIHPTQSLLAASTSAPSSSSAFSLAQLTFTHSPLPPPPPILDPLLDSTASTSSAVPHHNTGLDTFFESLDAFADPDSFTIDWDDLTQGLSPLGGGPTNQVSPRLLSTPGPGPVSPLPGPGPSDSNILLNGNGASPVQQIPPPLPPSASSNSLELTVASPPLGMRDDPGAQATPLYAQFNDGFFRSIPKPVREMMTQRMENVATSSDLGRAASMAMVLLYRVRTQAESGDGGGAERLIEQSNQYFQQALAHLQSPVPLEAQLVAVLDMQMHQFDQWGAAAANAILLIGEFFITEGMGPRPTLNLSHLFDVSNIALRCIAYTDVLRTVHSPRRKTLFGFTDAVGDSPRENYTPQSAVETHLGLPGGLLLCLAATSNLSAEKDSYTREEFREKAALIERAIKDWRAAPPEDDIDSMSYVEDVATQEMWRHAAVIHLYQTVHRVGPLHKSLRHSLNQMLQLGSRVSPRPPQNPADHLYAGCVRACPWFLAATVALPQERALCRQGLANCGSHKGYQDNIEAVEKIWALQDEDGQAGDWREVLEREGKVVAFL